MEQALVLKKAQKQYLISDILFIYIFLAICVQIISMYRMDCCSFSE